VVERLKSMAHGSVFATITRQTFDSILFVAPDPRVSRSFEAVASPLYDRIRAAVLENETLAKTRNYLLPKLMSGEVRVRDAERELVM
jgi:type I restriction enzyme S subunit